MHGVHEHRDFGQEFGDLASGAQAIHHRHHQIKNDEIGLEFLGFGNGFLTILDIHDFPGAGALQQATQGSSNRWIVLGNQDSDGHANRQAGRDGAPCGRAFP